MRILELGCGIKKGRGCPYTGKIVGVDVNPESKADVIWNLGKFPYPFKDNEFDAVYSRHCLEHLSDLIGVMKEIHRIVKPHGKVFLVMPYGASAASNPEHKLFPSMRMVYYFTTGSYRGIGEKYKFKLLHKRFNYVMKFPEFETTKGRIFELLCKPMNVIVNAIHPYIYEKILRYYIGDAEEIEWELEVSK
jgi:SAM-dependent methyltransferase